MGKIQVILILSLVAVATGVLYWLNKDNSVQTNEEGKTVLSPPR